MVQVVAVRLAGRLIHERIAADGADIFCIHVVVVVLLLLLRASMLMVVLLRACAIVVLLEPACDHNKLMGGCVHILPSCCIRDHFLLMRVLLRACGTCATRIMRDCCDCLLLRPGCSHAKLHSCAKRIGLVTNLLLVTSHCQVLRGQVMAVVLHNPMLVPALLRCCAIVVEMVNWWDDWVVLVVDLLVGGREAWVCLCWWRWLLDLMGVDWHLRWAVREVNHCCTRGAVLHRLVLPLLKQVIVSVRFLHHPAHHQNNTSEQQLTDCAADCLER